MTREELEHIIRASADITDQYEFIIIGCQVVCSPRGYSINRVHRRCRS